MTQWVLCDLTMSCLSQWVFDFQALFAGLLAIFAGGLAFGGAWLQARAAQKQAEVVVRVANEQKDETRRTAAAAFDAELRQCRDQLRRDAEKMAKTGEDFFRGAPIRKPRMEIYESNPSAIGQLPSALARSVANAYKWSMEMRDRYDDRDKQNARGEFYSSAVFASDAQETARIIEETLEALEDFSAPTEKAAVRL